MRLFPTRICGARTKSGGTCESPCVKGALRCHLHGGGTPSSRQAADEAAAGLRFPALTLLGDVIHDFYADPCVACGRPTKDSSNAIKAATQILNKTMPSAVAVQVTHTPRYEEWVAWMTDDELTQVQLCILNAKQRMAAGEPRQDTLPTIEANAVLVESTDPEQSSSPVGAEPKE